jgi:YD repeat-containing protein
VTTAYDPVGNVVSVTDARGNTTSNVYDRANRLVVTIAPEVCHVLI